VTADALAEAIAQGRAPAILDVRSRAEYRRGHVPGALHVPFWAIAWRVRRLPVSPDQPVVVYCGHGPRATIAAAHLRRRGFRYVELLDGHMAEWARRGLPQHRG
jgi:rhodanese-related sulfurtransferase